MRLRIVPALLAATFGFGAAQAEPAATLIRGARVFDGTGTPAVVQDVLVQGERIVALGPALPAPRGTRVLKAQGLTLIPGLHDLHTHLRSSAREAPDDLGKAYAAYLLNGVTTVNDYSVSGEMLAPIREMTGSGKVAAPHLELAIRLGVPGGHGTEFGWGNFFTLQAATPRAAHLAMAQALPYKPDLIKVFADGWRYGRDANLNNMDERTLAAIVQDAHAAGIPVITHTVTLEGAKVAAAAGIDALGHGVGDALVDDELIRLMQAHHTAYIATLVVFEPKEGRTFLPGEWRAMRPGERADEEERRGAAIDPVPAYEARRWTILGENMRRLHAAGIRIGIGTDAGVGGTYHGSSTLREIGWLTSLGFTPAQALAAATSVSADILGEAGKHGRIAAGERADLVLTGGRPDERIADLYDVRRVFVSGREVPLGRLRRLADAEAPSPLPVHLMAGPIDTGAGPAGRTDLDTLPVESTEAGVDHSHLDVVRLPDAARPLFAVARLGAAPRPFAQLVLPLTQGAVQLADARGFTGVSFQARGAGRYALLFDSYGIRPRGWFKGEFEAGAVAQEVRLPFGALRSADPSAKLDLARLRAVIVQLQGAPGGNAWLELGDVRFYR